VLDHLSVSESGRLGRAVETSVLRQVRIGIHLNDIGLSGFIQAQIDTGIIPAAQGSVGATGHVGDPLPDLRGYAGRADDWRVLVCVTPLEPLGSI